MLPETSTSSLLQEHHKLQPLPGCMILVLTGPSGVGKDTVAGQILSDQSLGIEKLVTYTTRPKRPGEVEGVDYHFVTLDKFMRLDLAERYEYRPGEWKGTPRSHFFDVLRFGRRLLWRIDPSRASQLDNFYRDNFGNDDGRTLLERTLNIYLGIPRLTVLYDRVRQRDGKKFDKTAFLYTLKNEDYPQWINNQSKFPHVIMNDGSVEQTVGQIINLVNSTFFKSA